MTGVCLALGTGIAVIAGVGRGIGALIVLGTSVLLMLFTHFVCSHRARDGIRPGRRPSLKVESTLAVESAVLVVAGALEEMGIRSLDVSSGPTVRISALTLMTWKSVGEYVDVYISARPATGSELSIKSRPVRPTLLDYGRNADNLRYLLAALKRAEALEGARAG